MKNLRNLCALFCAIFVPFLCSASVIYFNPFLRDKIYFPVEKFNNQSCFAVTVLTEFLDRTLIRYTKKNLQPQTFEQRSCSEKLQEKHSPFLFRFFFRLQICEYTIKVLHHHCFLNDFLKLFRTFFTGYISSNAFSKNDYVAEKTN